MERKRHVFILMVVFALALVGCAEKKTTAIEKEERIKISIAFWNMGDAFRGDPVLDTIEEKFGITFEPVKITRDDHYEKIKNWAAMDSLPDLFVGDFRNSAEYSNWVKQGLLHAIPDDLSAYPHLEEYMAGLGKENVPGEDGVLYCIPRQTYPSQAWTCLDRIIVYRWDLAQQAGITREPETWEEFQKMILAIIQADPEGTGIQGMTLWNRAIVSGMLLPYASPLAVSGRWKLDTDGLYKPAYFADDMTCAFQLGRDMYRSGVIERDALMETNSSAYEKFLRGENAALLDSGGYSSNYRELAAYWKEYHGRDYTEDVKALRLMPDVNGNKTYPIWGYVWSESYISAKVEPEKFDKILQVYDYLLSDEGALLGAYGPEGDLYEVVDGKVRMYDRDTAVQDKYPSCIVFSNLVRWFLSSYDNWSASDIPEEYIRVNYELVREAETVPLPEYEPECQTILEEEHISISIDMGNDFLRIMTGTRPVEEMWAQLQQEYMEKGMQETINLVNARMRE